MRKLVLGLVAATAVAAPIAMAASSANAATTDANGVVTVTKGEIMAQFPDMNEAAFQRIAMAHGESLTGSNVFTATTDTSYGCTDGNTYHHYRNTIITKPIALTEVYNGSANKVTGWTLGAKGASVITENNTGGTRFPDWNSPTICPAGTSLDFSKYNVAQSHSDVTSFVFNDTPVSIVVNPYVAPAPAPAA